MTDTPLPPHTLVLLSETKPEIADGIAVTEKERKFLFAVSDAVQSELGSVV